MIHFCPTFESIWLWHYSTSRKVTGSNPNEIIVIFFNGPNSSSRTMALGLTQPLTEMSTRNYVATSAALLRKTNPSSRHI
jgi:hypothetical protein